MAIGNRFNYLLIDASYILTRNLWIATKDTKPGEMNPGEVCRITIQTISKLYKDWGCSGDKPLLIWDEWSKELGSYIRSYMIKDFVTYKGSRKFMTQSILDEIKANPESTPEEIAKAEHELAVNKCKFEAKKIMKEQFRQIGIPSFSVPGYESDDICTLASFLLNDVSPKPNVIVTKDSDMSFSLSPNTYQFLVPTKGKDPEFVDYNTMYYKIPQVLRDRGMSLYMYHAYCDSLGVTGHNDNLKTIKPGVDGTTAILHIMDGDFSDVENIPAFQAQMRSFDLSNFPDLDRVQDMILNQFPVAGHIGTIREFKDFCARNNITGISDAYYMTFSDRLEQRLYSEGL
jgi:5'-3' exonuclease